jgi:uncharacterized protein YdhG (YjbR/CyaY superfamily)
MDHRSLEGKASCLYGGFEPTDILDHVEPGVEAYFAHLESSEARASLLFLRTVIFDEVPEAEEMIRYGMPTYKYHGFLASIAAFKRHCSFFPGHTVREFSEELKGYNVARGTVQFPHGKPPPEPLIRAMIRARADENFATQA